MSLGVNIISNFKAEGIKKAIAEFNKLKTSSEKTQFALKKAALPAAAALTAVAAAAGHAMKAAMENQASQERFSQVIKSVTGATDAQMQSINNSIDAMARQTGIADDNLRPAMQYLVVATGSVATAQKDMALAMDISAATGADLESVTSALGKAHNGVTKGLVALDPSLKGVLGTTKDFTVIQDLLTQKFGGSEAAFEKTAAGGMRKFQNSMSEMWESIGNALLPALQKVLPFLTAFGEWGQQHSTLFVVLAAGVAAFSAAILIANTALKVMAIWEAVVNAENPFALIVLAVVAVIAIVTALYMRFEIVRTVVNAVINAIIAIIENWLNAWIRVINLIIDGINLLIKAANFFGAGLHELGHIGEVEFGRIGDAAGASANAIKTYGNRLEALAASFGVVKKSSKDTPPFGGGGSAKTVETAKEKLNKFIDALKGSASAQKQYRDATKAALKADTDLLAKKTKLTEAQANFNRVTKGYGAGSKEATSAQDELAKAQRDAERAGYDVEAAVFAVKKAEDDLAAARQDPASTPQVIREAEIALAEAKLAVADSTDSQKQSTNDLTLAQSKLDETVNGAKEGSDAYTEALKALQDAQEEYTSAIETQTDAYDQLAQAVDAVRVAEDKLAESRKTTPKGIQTKAASLLSQTKTPADAAAAAAAAAAGQTLSQDQKDALMAARGGMFSVPFFAHGGIVTSPTLGMIGEAGSEAIIPLSQLGAIGGTTNIHVTVNAGMGTDPAKLGDEIVNILARYQKRNGALPLKVA